MRKSNSDVLKDVKLWFEGFFLEVADYYAVMTRRCLNLMEVVVAEYSDEMSSQSKKKFDQVITENGLLLSAERIALSFVEKREFPRIALADDLLVHGRSINRFFQVFYKLVKSFLENYSFDLSEKEVEEAFYQSITLWIYAENDTVSLLQPELRRRLKVRYIWPESTWRDFSLQIAGKIYSSNLANTSYVVSAKCPTDLAKPFLKSNKKRLNNWISYAPETKVRRRDASAIYLHPIAGEFNNFYPIVRRYDKGNEILFIPYLFSQFEVDDTILLEKYLRNKVEKERESAVGVLLDLMQYARQTEQLHSILGQLVYLILSACTLSNFFSFYEIDNLPVTYDIQKIARNFGNYDSKGRSVAEALSKICQLPCNDDMMRDLCAFLTPLQCEEKEAWERDESVTLITEDKPIMDVIKNLIYQQAVEHEYRAHKAKRIYASGGSLPADMLDITGERPLHLFLQNVFKEVTAYEDNVVDRVMELLYDLTHEMDIGDISLKTRVSNDGCARMCYSAVRNTELSLSIFPRMLGKYYLDVVRVVKAFWKEKDFPQYMRWYFEEILIPYDKAAADYKEVALEFADIIQSNRQIIDVLIDWKPGMFRNMN